MSTRTKNVINSTSLIVGNASNKLGEFSCVYIPFEKLRMFAFVAEEADMVGVMNYILTQEREALDATAWHDPPDVKYVCALLPNFFILYFGQKPPTGDITSDDVKLEFAALGKGMTPGVPVRNRQLPCHVRSHRYGPI
jgi:hypothetical protein